MKQFKEYPSLIEIKLLKLDTAGKQLEISQDFY